MNVFELTRRLIDIESITPNEREVGNFLFDHLAGLARELRRCCGADAGGSRDATTCWRISANPS